MVWKIVSCLICTAMLILSFWYLRHLHNLLTTVSLMIFGSLLISLVSIGQKLETTFKLLVVTTLFLSFLLVGFVILDHSGMLARLSDLETLKNLILKTKQWGILTFFLITLLQVIVLPIPAAITILLGVAIYGSWVSFFVSSVGTILGSLVSFYIGRSFGKRIVIWIFGEEKTEKYADFLARGKIAFVFMMLLPIFPDDLICMLAGITNMSKKYFIVTMSITRTVAIAAYCFLGSGEIIPFRGWGIPVWLGFFAAITLAYLIAKKVFSKKKT